MAFMLKLRSEIKQGRRRDYEKAASGLCAAMQDFPGIICYHIDYPEEHISEWTEIYADDDTFKAHFGHPKAAAPIATLIEAGAGNTTCRCWGEPNAETRAMLEAQGATFHESGEMSFILNRAAGVK